MLFVGSSVFGNPRKSRLVGHVDFSVEFLFLLGPSVYPTPSTRLSELRLMFGYASLYLSQSAVGWSLSEDSYARVLSACLTELSLIGSGIGSYPRDGSQFGASPLSLFCLCPCTSCRQDTSLGQRFCG